MLDVKNPYPSCVRPIMVTIGFTLLFILMACFATPSQRVVYDVSTHHLPVIRQFASEWPTPYLGNYKVATTPGYHLLMAAAMKMGLANEIYLRFIGGLFGVGLAWVMARHVTPWVLAIPLLVSLYVVSSTIYLLPETAAWWLVALIVARCLQGRVDLRFYLVAGGATTLLVLIRQTHAWVMLPVVLTVCVTTENQRFSNRIIRAVLCVLPTMVVLGFFVWLWKGLTPPFYQSDAPPSTENLEIIRYGRVSLVPIGFTLGLIGLYGLFFSPWFVCRSAWKWCLLGAMFGGLLGAIPESTVEYPFRVSGVWHLFAVLPAIGGRSLGFVASAALGGAVVAGFLYRLKQRDAAILAAVLIGFILAHLPNPMIWQRYYEPFVLIWLAFASSRATVVENRVSNILQQMLPAVLALGLLLVTCRSLKIGF